MQLRDLQDIYQGRLGFVIGGGPSLHFQDVTNLKDYVTISVNSGIQKIPQCDFFISDDIGAKNWNYFQKTAKESKCIKLLYEDKLKSSSSIFDPKEVVLFKHKWWYSPESKTTNLAGLELTRDAEMPIVGARTSAASALHFLYIMGCDPIVLLGCDACYREGKRYFWQFKGENRAFRISGEPVFCSANKGKLRDKPVDAHCVDFNDYWNKFANQNRGKANIIYASEGGILECFPKMTLEDVFSLYGSRKKEKESG